MAGLPVYTVQCADGTSNQVTDPGRAVITGKGADIGEVKGPIPARTGRTCTLFS